MRRPKPPKAIQGDPLLGYQISLARELGKTLKELERDMGTGELALQIAYDDIEMTRRAAKKAAEERRAQRAPMLAARGW